MEKRARRRGGPCRGGGAGDGRPAMADAPPCFEVARVEALARELLGHPVTASALPSERDQNFLLTVAGGPRLVLKIAGAGGDRAFLPAGQRAVQHLAGGTPPTPRGPAGRGGAAPAPPPP